MMHQLSAKSKREKGRYKTLPLMDADQRGSARIPSSFKSKISKHEADPRPSVLIRPRSLGL
jgi:hypothetical protein